MPIAVPNYGDDVLDNQGNVVGQAAYDPNTGQPLNNGGNSIGAIYGSNSDVEYNTGGQNYQDLYSGIIKPVNEDKIRSDILSGFQKQIDAVNSVYNNKISESRQAGLGRLGVNRAIQARRGLAGSDFGAAQTNTVDKANRDEIAGIEAEKLAMVQGLLNEGNNRVSQEIAAKNEARRAGLKEYMDNLGTFKERQTAKAGEIASTFLNSGQDISTMKEDELNKIAKSWGVSSADIKSAYTNTKKAAEDAAAQAELDANKDFSLNEGEDYYKYNPKTKKMELVASKAKTYKPETGGGSGDMGALLSINEAKTLGVPYGTTRGQAIAKGLIPGQTAGSSMVKESDIQALLDNPKFNRIFGAFDQKFGGTINSDAILARKQYEQIVAKLKLDNRKVLKGQGAVSDFEGRTLAEAASTLDRAFNETTARKVLTDLLNTVRSGGVESDSSDEGTSPDTIEAGGQTLVLGPDGKYYPQ